MKKTWLSFVFSGFLLLLVGFILGANINLPQLWRKNSPTSTSTAQLQSDVDLSTFWEVWRLLGQKFYEPDKMVTQEMVDGATAGMVASLGDPYTMYLPPEVNEISGEDLAGVFYGIGIELGYKDHFVAVVAPLDDTPAAKAGLQAGDIIMHVKDEKNKVDEDTTDWSLDKAQSVIRGKERYSPLTLTLFREDYNDNLPFDVELKRDEIVVKSVKLSWLEQNGKKIAHLKMSRFGENTASEWNNAVNEILLYKNSLGGVVLDLRNNPGGYFDEALHVASEFIPNGVIVTQQGLKDKQSYTASGRGRLFNVPLVVLVNKGSASASEIVAGALRDRLKTQLVGETTFGKGLVQERVEVAGGGGLHVTIAKWVMPGGDWIQETGIEVDIEAKDDYETPDVDEALERAISELK
jgi:carboxyl-terminal processing protease